MRTTKRISVIGLIAVLVMLYCCPVFAETGDWTLVKDLKINEKAVYTDDTGKLAFLEDLEYTQIEGLEWDGSTCTLTMNGANLKSINYTKTNGTLTLNLIGENSLKDVEPLPNPENTKNSVFICQGSATITGSGNLSAILDNDDYKDKKGMHYVVESFYLTLSPGFSGEFTVEHREYPGSALNIVNDFSILGGAFKSNAEVDATNVLIDGGNVRLNIQDYSQGAITTSTGQPELDSGNFTMTSGSLWINNHGEHPKETNLRGIWSGGNVLLNGGTIYMDCDGQGIFNEVGKVELNGAHLTIISRESVALHANELEVNNGDADLTGKKISVFINKENTPILGGQMKIIEPEGGHFDITEEIGSTCYTVLDKNDEITPRAVFAPEDYNVTFHGEGGKWGSNPTRTQHATLFKDGIYYVKSDDFVLPTMTGYHLGGWTYNGGETFTFLTDQDTGTAIPKAGLDVYPVWVENLYTVSFDANGGLGEMDDQQFVYDQEQNLYKNTFTRKGFDFAGWKNPETGETYSDEECVKNLTAEYDGNVVLQAQWKAIASPIKTGDNNPLYLYIALGGASILAIYMIIRRKSCKN